jgi:hypothetical protein
MKMKCEEVQMRSTELNNGMASQRRVFFEIVVCLYLSPSYQSDALLLAILDQQLSAQRGLASSELLVTCALLGQGRLAPLLQLLLFALQALGHATVNFFLATQLNNTKQKVKIKQRA